MDLTAQSRTIRIWVIDDDQSMRWVLEKTLSNNGYQITAFESGSVALAQFKRSLNKDRPQLIITDERMPGISGFELLRQIKHLAPDIPIIVMTAYTDLESTQRGFQEGAFEYLPKPFDIDHALELVARAVTPVDIENAEDLENTTDLCDWEVPLGNWARQQLSRGESDILKLASKTFERTLLDCALEASRGRKQDAARRLGWGRNTLTRKLKELS